MSAKRYLLLADKKGYGLAGETVTLNDKRAEFLLLSGAIAPVQEEAPTPSDDTGSGEATTPRARKVKPG